MRIVIFKECVRNGSLVSFPEFCLHLVVARDRWEALGMLHKKIGARRADSRTSFIRTVDIGKRNAKKEIVGILERKKFLDDAEFVQGLKRVARGDIVSTLDFLQGNPPRRNKAEITSRRSPPPISVFVHRTHQTKKEASNEP